MTATVNHVGFRADNKTLRLWEEFSLWLSNPIWLMWHTRAPKIALIFLEKSKNQHRGVFFFLTLLITLTNRDGFRRRRGVVNEWWIRGEGKHHKLWHAVVVCRMINSAAGWNLPLRVSRRRWLPLYLSHPAGLHLQGSGGNQSLLLLPEVTRCIYHH